VPKPPTFACFDIVVRGIPLKAEPNNGANKLLNFDPSPASHNFTRVGYSSTKETKHMWAGSSSQSQSGSELTRTPGEQPQPESAGQRGHGDGCVHTHSLSRTHHLSWQVK